MSLVVTVNGVELRLGDSVDPEVLERAGLG